MQSLKLIYEAFSGTNKTAMNIVAFNAGAAIYVSGLTSSLQNGIDKAKEILADGSASQKLKEYIKISNSYKL